MDIGLLWYDGNPKKSVQAKIEEGAECYRDKFGARPNACHVNPLDITEHDGLLVVGNNLIRPNHFWLGFEAEEETVRSTKPHEETRSEEKGRKARAS
jgi:hypothetical protein